MGQWKPAPIIFGSYADDTRLYSAQDVINYLPEKAETQSTPGGGIARGIPGMLAFASLGSGPIRGSRNVEGRLFVVSGTTLYELKNDATSTNIGTISGSVLVRMTHNQIAGGNQVVIATGGTTYVYNTVTATLAAITSTSFPGALAVDYIDSYIVGVEPLGNYWYISNLADATSYSTLDRYSAEAAPDKIIDVRVNHERVLIFGARTIESWANNGTATGTFVRIPGTIIEYGAAATNGQLVIDNTVLFLRNDGIFCRLEGYTPVRISTHAIEQGIAGLDWSQAIAWEWTDRGHSVAYWTFPDGHTWGYDIATGLWHRRNSYNFNRWRINTMAYWGGSWMAGDCINGTIYQLDWGSDHDNNTVLSSEMIFPSIRTGNRSVVHGVKFLFDTGRIEKNPGKPLSNIVSPSISITGAPPDGEVGQAYSYKFTVAGGTGIGNVVTLESGSYPAGTARTTTTWTGDTCSGTATTKAAYPFVLRVTDSAGNTSIGSFVINIAAKSFAHLVAADNPVLFWKLNETSGTTAIDYSGNSRNGTIAGSYTLAADGLVLNAIDTSVIFPGNIAGSPLDVGTTTAWSMEAVITRTAGAVNSSVLEWICGQWRSPNFGYYTEALVLNALGGVAADQKKAVGAFTESGSLTLNSVQTANKIVDATRTHLMVVRTPGSGGFTGRLDIYVNGVLSASNASFDSTQVGIISNGAGFVVGGGQAANGYYPASYGYLGKVQNVVVYASSVSAANILLRAQALGLA
jgi:hypothetical protein